MMTSSHTVYVYNAVGGGGEGGGGGCLTSELKITAIHQTIVLSLRSDVRVF